MTIKSEKTFEIHSEAQFMLQMDSHNALNMLSLLPLKNMRQLLSRLTKSKNSFEIFFCLV